MSNKTIDLALLNASLSNLRKFRNNNKQIEKIVEKEIIDEGNMGDEGIAFETYKLPNVEDVYVTLKITTDSYGDNESVTGITFVEPKEKVITQYIPI